jgi:PAS domain S-box-containing protein
MSDSSRKVNILLPNERQLHSSPAPVRVTATSLHQFFDMSPDALLVIGPAGTIMMVNEQTEALFGFARSELVSQQLEILLPERFRDPHSAHRERFFSAPRTRQMGAGLQLSGKRKDGTEFPVDISLRPLLIDEAFHVMAAVRDMTTAREIEQHLSILNMMLSLTGSSVSLFDTQGRYRFASENTANHLGLAQRDFVGKTWQELGLPAEFMAPVVAQLQKVLSTGQSVVEEILFSVTSGMRWFECVAQPVVDQNGEVTSLVVSSQDITERKQGEDALHRLASIVESSGDAIYSNTLEGVITSWNSSAEKLLGYTADEIIGKSISLIIPPDRQKELPQILARITAGETVQHHETTRMRKDGTHIEVSVTVSPGRDSPAEACVGIVGNPAWGAVIMACPRPASGADSAFSHC